MEENLSRLWQNLRQKTPEFTIDYEQFKVDMQNDENLLKVHTNLVQRDKDFKVDFTTFKSDMGITKEGPTAKAIPSPIPEQITPEVRDTTTAPYKLSPEEHAKIKQRRKEQYEEPSFWKQVARKWKRKWMEVSKGVSRGLELATDDYGKINKMITQVIPKHLLPVVNPMGTVNEYMQSNVDLAEYALDQPEYKQLAGMEKYDEFFWENKNWTKPKYLTMQLVDQIPIMIGAVAANIATGGIGSFAFMSSLEAGFAHEELVTIQTELNKEGYAITDEQIKELSLGVGVINGMLELASGSPMIARTLMGKSAGKQSIRKAIKELVKSGNYKQFLKSTGKLVLNLQKVAAPEGATELLQEFTLETAKLTVKGEPLHTALGKVLTTKESRDVLIQSGGVGYFVGGVSDVSTRLAPGYQKKYQEMKKKSPHRERIAKNKVSKGLGKINRYIGKGEYGKAKDLEIKFRKYLIKLGDYNVLSQEKMENTQKKIDDLATKIDAGGQIKEKPTEVAPVKREVVKVPEIITEKTVEKKPIVKEKVEKKEVEAIAEKDVPILKAYGALDIPTKLQKSILLKDKALKLLESKLDQAEVDGDLDGITNINKKIKSEKAEIDRMIKELPTIEKVEIPKAEVIQEEKIVAPVKEEKTVALKKEEIKKIRKDFGMEKLDKATSEQWVNVLQEAKSQKKDEEAMLLVRDVISNPRVLTTVEHASLVLKAAQLQDIYEENIEKASDAVDKGEDARRYEARSEMAISELELLTIAADNSGREVGRAINIRKMRINRENYRLTTLIMRAKAVKGKTLTDVESNTIKRLAKKIKEQEQRIDELTKDIEGIQSKFSQEDAETTIKKELRKVKKVRKQSDLAKERKSLKEQMAALGYRINEVTGVTFEIASIISKLARNYIESGATTLSEVITKMKEDIPDLSDRDIYDSLGGRIKRIKKTVESNTQKTLRELKKQAKLLGDIEDAYRGIFKKPVPKKIASDKVRSLRQKFNRLKALAYKTTLEDKTLNDILDKINTIRGQIETGQRYIKKPPKVESIAIKEAKQELSELRRLMSTKDKIADLENQLKTGEFKVPIKTRGIIKNAQLRDAQIELQQLRRKVRDHIHRLKKRTLREKFIDVITLPRTLLATADMSYALRQASFLSARRPVKAVKIFSKAFKTFFSQNKADAIDIAIREHPNQAIRDKAGLFLASMDNIRFTDREEMFVSNLGERIPVWGKIVRASDRNMVSGLNMMRAACFDSFLKSNPNATDVELKAWADYVNVASGRGNLGKFIGATEYLSTVLFAPRFSASRFQTPFKLMQYWKHKTVRKEIAKDMLAFVALGMTTLTLAGLAGADVGDDPESSDFGKIIIGNTRVDVWGGFQQPARLMLVPILKGLDKAGIRKMTSHIDIYDAASRFSTYKLSPSITIPVELLQGKTVVGEEVTAVQTLARNVVPLALQDTYEIATGSENIAKTLILGTGAFMGLSMAEHKARGRRRAARR